MPLVDPVAVPLLRLRGRDEVLHLHLLELERAEDEVPRRDLVPEGLPDLRDPERRLAPGDLRDVLEVDEDALRCLGAQVRVEPRLLDGADARLEHEVELARLGEVAVRRLARLLARLPAAGDLLVLRICEVIRPEAELARPAVDERVGEAADVARRLPDARVQDHGRVERNDVVALADHRLEPARLDVLLHQHAVVPVVVGRAEPAVDLGRREHEPAPACERDDLLHRYRVGHSSGRYWYTRARV